MSPQSQSPSESHVAVVGVAVQILPRLPNGEFGAPVMQTRKLYTSGRMTKDDAEEMVAAVLAAVRGTTLEGDNAEVFGVRATSG